MVLKTVSLIVSQPKLKPHMLKTNTAIYTQPQ